MKLSNLLIVLYAGCITLVGCGQPDKPQTIPQQKQQNVLPSPMIVEIIAKKGSVVKEHPLTDMKDYGIVETREWKNHTMIYAYTSDHDLLIKGVKHEFPEDSIKIYDAPFYTFDRKMCADSERSAVVQRIFFTANLVADPKLQQEYLDYHKNQLQKWPEVSQGFCKARFQQLLVFKSGRQLMLMISIPEGEDLNKLNPLTTKNNPRVDDWNKLMAKYQERIPGTKRGETWVLLTEIKNLY